MDLFDKLNRETREWNARNVDRYNPSNPKTNASESWLNYYNNQTYKINNGEYSKKYY